MTTQTTHQRTPKVTHQCPRCGQNVTQGQGGRPKKWCSDTCRKRASQERTAARVGGVDVRLVTVEHAAPVAPVAPPSGAAPQPTPDWAVALGALCRGRSTDEWVALVDAVTEGITSDTIDNGPPFDAVLEAFHRLCDAVAYRRCLPLGTFGRRDYGDPRPPREWLSMLDDVLLALTRGTIDHDDRGVLVAATAHPAIVAEQEHAKRA